MNEEERRSSLRGSMVFKVKLRFLSPEEYGAMIRADGQQGLPDFKEVFSGVLSGEVLSGASPWLPCLIDFLLRMDAKLDRVISLLSEDEGSQENYQDATGTNISALGMKLKMNNPVCPGQLLHTHFLLPKMPLLRVEAFGEVIHVTEREEGGTTLYDVGVRFLGLDQRNREKIIACVFQCERMALRTRRMNGAIHDNNGKTE